MANPFLKAILNETDDPALDVLLGRDGAGEPESGVNTRQDAALNTILGRDGGEAPEGDEAEDEGRELEIGNEMLAAIDELPPYVQRDFALTRLADLARELVSMHQ